MNKYIHRLVFTLITLFLLLGGFTACTNLKNIDLSSIGLTGGKPHKMQYLIYRNYLYNIGLNKPTELVDLKGDQLMSRIEVSTDGSKAVKDYMVFNINGDLVSVSREKHPVKVVDFRYDKQGKLISIIPNLEQLPTIEYDSINIVYESNKPKKMIFMSNNAIKYADDILFDDENEIYQFKRKRDNVELFDIYNYTAGKPQSEYHKNRVEDSLTDSITYFYNSDKLVKKIGKYSQTTTINTTYDRSERPIENEIILSQNDSITWTDKYFYQIDDRIPYQIISSSPLGWKEEVNFRWYR